MKKYLLEFIAVSLIVFTTCSQPQVPEGQSSTLPSHKAWNTLLQKNVNVNGGVDYVAFVKDSVLLNDYIDNLTSNPPSKTWSPNDQLAFWINLYNVATIKLVTRHYPISSIKDIGGTIQIPYVNTPWQIEFIRFKNNTIDLDHIEHGIIRKQFNEPRIHFALVCAAMSCPKLRNEAYTGSNLDQQLTDQTKLFLMNKTKNIIQENEIVISKLFKWYSGDFSKSSNLIEFLNKYSPVIINKDADVAFMDYNWQLNEK